MAGQTRHVTDHVVADGVAMGVVDRLEAVDVDDQHGKEPAVAIVAGHHIVAEADHAACLLFGRRVSGIRQLFFGSVR